jgi:hypothetical protein
VDFDGRQDFGLILPTSIENYLCLKLLRILGDILINSCKTLFGGRVHAASDLVALLLDFIVAHVLLAFVEVVGHLVGHLRMGWLGRFDD